MSPELHDLTRRLLEVLSRQTDRLGRLADTLAKHRTSFVALRAADLLEGLDGPSGLVEELQDIEQERHEINAALAPALGLEPTDIRVSRLVEMLPPRLANELSAVAAGMDSAARRVRTETLVGNRLLQLSEQTNAGILTALVDAGQTTTYGKDARQSGGMDRSGSLVSGTA